MAKRRDGYEAKADSDELMPDGPRGAVKASVQTMDLLGSLGTPDLDDDGRVTIPLTVVGRIPNGRKAQVTLNIEWTWPTTVAERQAMVAAAKTRARAEVAAALDLEAPPTQGRFVILELIG